jgi:hypothetical protein
VNDAPRIEHVPIDELVKWPGNPKRHDVETIKASMRRFGFVAPIVIDDATGRIVAGHGRAEALVAMRDAGEKRPARVALAADAKGWLVPVLRGVAFGSEREAEAYLLADNRLVELAGWNNSELAQMLREAPSLDGTGFSQVDLDVLLMMSHVESARVGKTPEERLDGFLSAEVKQVVLYFAGKDYEHVLGKLAELRARYSALDNSVAILKLLDEQNFDQPGL